MTEQRRGRVAPALRALLNELNVELDWVNEEGGKALQEGDYHRVEEIAVRGKEIKAFSQKVAGLHAEWEGFSKGFAEPRQGTPSSPSTRQPRRPVRPGFQPDPAGTPRDAFRLPILQALVEMDGRGARTQIFARLHEMMKHQLREHDLASVPSGSVRWHGKAQSARQAMVREGLLSRDSLYGIWEITEAGRSFLADSQAGPRPASEQAQEGAGLAPSVQTSMDTYVLAILEALEDVGGTAKTIDVLHSVGQTMKLQDSASEGASLPGNAVRFRHSMRRARAAMVQQGLLRADSPRAVWEITEAGRTLLAKARSDQ